MTRHQVLTALVAVIAVGVIAAVVYLERTNRNTAPPAEAVAASVVTTVPTTAADGCADDHAPADDAAGGTLPPPDRALVPAVVSSGPSDGQCLVPATQRIAAVGRTDIRPLTGSVPLTNTVLYSVAGMQAAAELLPTDAGVPITSTAPMDQAPPVAGLANAQLLFYFGGS